MGIYAISGVADERALIGSTNDLERRWKREHFPQLKRNAHYNPLLQCAWNEHGEDGFLFLVLARVDKESDLKPLEERMIQEQMLKGAAYNVKRGASSGMRGRKHSAETRSRMSKAKTGERHPRFGKGKEFRAVAPDGEIITEKGLSRFCKEHNLNLGCMSSVLSGRITSHKGWRAATPRD